MLMTRFCLLVLLALIAMSASPIFVSIANGQVLSSSSPIINVEPTVVRQGENVVFTGSGFTPNGTVITCIATVVGPGMGSCIVNGNADGVGNIDITMLVGTNIFSGSQTAWAWDGKVFGTRSNTVFITVNPSGTNESAPQIAVLPTIVIQGMNVTFDGGGFTPNGTVQMCIAARCVSDQGLTARNDGSISLPMLVGSNVPTGQQPAWVVDVSKQIISNTVAITVNPVGPSTGESPSAIPGFPLEAIVAGLIIGITAIIILRRKTTTKRSWH